MLLQVLLDHLLAVAGEAGVDVDRHQLIVDRCFFTQRLEDMQQGIGILPAGDADGDPVARLDQVEIADRLADLLFDSEKELIDFCCQLVTP